MIVGIVQGREPLIHLTIRGSGARQQEIEAVVDTGYTEFKMHVRAWGKVTIKRLPRR